MLNVIVTKVIYIREIAEGCRRIEIKSSLRSATLDLTQFLGGAFPSGMLLSAAALMRASTTREQRKEKISKFAPIF